jgi:hypothetical protein
MSMEPIVQELQRFPASAAMRATGSDKDQPLVIVLPIAP